MAVCEARLESNSPINLFNFFFSVKFTEFPRRRPVTHRPQSNFDLHERSRKSSPVQQPIITRKFSPNRNVAIVEPRPNVHEPPLINQNPFYLCQPEVRKARREILIKKRPPSPRQTIAASVRHTHHTLLPNEDEENQSYNERSRIIKSPVKPPVQVTIENFDDTKAAVVHRSPIQYGRRASGQAADINGNTQAKRNLSKIIEGNYEYTPKKKSSLSSSTMDEEYGNDNKKLVHSQSLESPSFVILKDPIKQNKWMKSSWYL